MNDEPKDFAEVKQTKKKKILTEEHKEKNRANLAKARAKLAEQKASKQESGGANQEPIKKQSIQEYQKEQIDEDIDLETLLDKKFKKKQQKADKIKMLEDITTSNKQLLDKFQKIEDRVEKLYTLKKNKRRIESPKREQQPIIIQQMPQQQQQPQPYKSGNDKLRELLSKPTNYIY